MTLIKSISGIRGTIGGNCGEALTPIDIVKFTSAYAKFISNQDFDSNTIILGRDARISGPMLKELVTGTLIGCGLNVLDLGLSTTPTVEVAVKLKKAAGGIILTASHNPKEWNALKLLNNKGEFISEDDANQILSIVDNKNFKFSNVESLGNYSYDNDFNDTHINEVLNLDLVNVELVKSAKFTVVLDAVNSTGGIIIPKLLEKMGVKCIKLYCEPNGHFPHNPEPLPENINDLSELVLKKKADFGIVVDPDVDRLAFICDDGTCFGEEYTLVAVADYVLSKIPGNTVSNLSSTRALKDITIKHEGEYFASAVGEVNVVDSMKVNNAIIGGEGNGGVIYPELHYGRDALVGIALFLTSLAEKKISIKSLRDSYPNYFLLKKKIESATDINMKKILTFFTSYYQNEKITTIDGIKIDFKDQWVHIRKSNTEPILRVYIEGTDEEKANDLAEKVIKQIQKLL